MNFKQFKKTALVVLAVILVSFVFVQSAHAQAFAQAQERVGSPINLNPLPLLKNVVSSIGTGLLDITAWALGKSLYGVAIVFSYIAAVIVGLGAWGLSVLLALNNDVLNTPIVQIGFSVALSIANLGFILGIIVIAISTILHLESYGIKQILWKLVVAAVLVNFSLVIAGPIINVANGLSFYFLNCTAGDCSGSSVIGGSGAVNFSTALTGAFNPQKGWAGVYAKEESEKIANLDKLKSSFSGSISALLIPITAAYFTLIMSVVIVITLWALNFMLMIRYAMIGILLVLMPFVWLMWIFPMLHHHWSKWWKKFLQWTFFPPIVIFFLYLAILTSNGMRDNGIIGGFTKGNAIWDSIDNSFSNVISGLISAFVQEFIVVALAVGGMIAAHEMGIKGAEAVTSAMKNLGTYGAKTLTRVGLKGASKITGGVASSSLLGWAAAHQRTPQFATGAIMRTSSALGSVSTYLSKAAESKYIKTPYGAKGLLSELKKAAKDGTGVFGKKGILGKGEKKDNQWECGVCGEIIYSTKKPTRDCPNSTTPVSHPAGTPTQNWRKVD